MQLHTSSPCKNQGDTGAASTAASMPPMYVASLIYVSFFAAQETDQRLSINPNIPLSGADVGPKRGKGLSTLGHQPGKLSGRHTQICPCDMQRQVRPILLAKFICFRSGHTRNLLSPCATFQRQSHSLDFHRNEGLLQGV